MASGARVTTGGCGPTPQPRLQGRHPGAQRCGGDEHSSGLNPVTFKYKASEEERHVGFIAEDVPELVATKDRKGMSRWTWSPF